jgi:hypothetical protein
MTTTDVVVFWKGENMQMRLMTEQGRLCLRIRYDKGEWDTLENVLSSKLQLRKSTIANGWGRNETIDAYVTNEESLKRYLLNSFNLSRIFDDLNSPLFHNERFNVAFFRVIPDDNVVVIPLDKYVTVSEINQFLEVFRKVYKILFEISSEMTIDISIHPDEVEV